MIALIFIESYKNLRVLDSNLLVFLENIVYYFSYTIQ